MKTTKDIMETCWEADASYQDVVEACRIANTKIPTEFEYQAYCASAEVSIQDWMSSGGQFNELSDDDYLDLPVGNSKFLGDE